MIYLFINDENPSNGDTIRCCRRALYAWLGIVSPLMVVRLNYYHWTFGLFMTKRNSW